ncbi:MAG: hypothetical protein GYB34_18170 [Gammaproteobacteria bacterium]|nr:hypothetical protein [Gammaproteobacteria bacterium]
MTVKIYSNQLDYVKTFAHNCCRFICDRHRNQLMPSSFKRNDAISRALGYKSHSDLVSLCKGNTPLESDDRFSHVSLLRNHYEPIAREFVSIFKGLSYEQIHAALTKPAPKQTEFEVIDGTPVVQFSPLASDISNELREDSEIAEWWDVPYILDNWDADNHKVRNYSVHCLDGGAWDRATGKAWVDTLPEAIAAARQLKEDTPWYRDYAKPLVTTISVSIGKHVPDTFNQYIAYQIVHKIAMTNQYIGIESCVVSFIDEAKEITNDELADAADGLIQTSIDTKYQPGELDVVRIFKSVRWDSEARTISCNFNAQAFPLYPLFLAEVQHAYL